jgi:tetratricopeptide (TPR) repeat protein
MTRGAIPGDPVRDIFRTSRALFLRDEDYSRMSLGDLIAKAEATAEIPPGVLPSLFREVEVTPIGGSTTEEHRVLIVDNFDALLEFVSEPDLEELAKSLAVDRTLVLASSTKSRKALLPKLSKLGIRFDALELEALSKGDASALLIAWAKSLRVEALVDHLTRRPGEVEALALLTGGVPRYIVGLLNAFVKKPDMDVEEALLALLDLLSPHFQAVLSGLAPQQRRIVDVMARAPYLLSPTEIAQRSGMDVATVNVQLGRLARKGDVRFSRIPGRKMTLYELKDRVFRAWRRLRTSPGQPESPEAARQLRIWNGKASLWDELRRSLSKIGQTASTGTYMPRRPCPPILWFEGGCEVPSRDYLFTGLRPYDVMSSLDPSNIRDILRHRDLSKETKELLEELIVQHFEGPYDVDPAVLTRILERERDIPEVWNELGNVRERKGQFDEALEAYERALEILPRSFVIPYNIGNTLYDQGNYGGASKAYGQALERDPGIQEIWHNRAFAEAARDDVKEAVRCLYRSLELRYKAFKEINRLTQTYYSNEQFEKAEGAKESGREIRKEALEGLCNLLEWAWNDIESDALRQQICENITELAPGHAKYWNVLGNLHARSGNYDRALSCYDRACDPDSPEFRIHLLNRANTQLWLSRFEEGAADAARAVEELAKDGDETLKGLASFLYACAELLCSESYLEGDSFREATGSLMKALDAYARVRSPELENLFAAYAKGLLERGRVQTLTTLVREVRRRELGELREFLSPYDEGLILGETTGEPSVDRFPLELRSMVGQIAGNVLSLRREPEESLGESQDQGSVSKIPLIPKEKSNQGSDQPRAT